MSPQEFNDIVLDISRSGLDLKELHVSHWTSVNVDMLRELGLKMKNLTTLGCVYEVLKYMDLVLIASSIPQLQVLDVSPSVCQMRQIQLFDDGCLTDEKIKLIASNARQMRQIQVFDNLFVTDELLIALSLNCKFLTKLAVGDFMTKLVVGDFTRGCKLTENSIAFVLRHCPNLTSLWIHGIKSNNSPPSVPSSLFSFENSISHARALCDLDIQHMIISDALLCSIVKDQSMFLRNVSHLEIWGGDQLTDSTFFILTENCPCLIELELKNISLGRGGNFHLEQAENQNIK